LQDVLIPLFSGVTAHCEVIGYETYTDDYVSEGEEDAKFGEVF